MCVEIAFEGVGAWLDMSGFRGVLNSIEFQITGAAERKEREPKLVLDGVWTGMCWRGERTD